MMILAIDPGPEKSAWVIYYRDTKRVGAFAIEKNDDVLVTIQARFGFCFDVVIEMIASYGMPVGKEVFDTARWVGRFEQQFAFAHSKEAVLVYRMEVKQHLCQNSRAKDGNIRQAIIDRFPATGGGKVPQIGTKKQPGPLYGVVADLWQALGVAITYAETKT